MDNYEYILDGTTPVVCNDPAKFSQWFNSDNNRRVAETTMGEYWVSTVFLGFDHNFGGSIPVLFETMIFPSDILGAEYQERYCTWDEAEEGHQRAVEYLRHRQGC